MLESWITRWGYLALVFGTFFEGEAVLILAGALARKGLLHFPFVVLAAFCGSVAGDQLWFHLGRRFGRALLARRPAWRSKVDVVQRGLARRGDLFVFGFRFLYGLRTIAPVLLGMSEISGRRFTVLNFAGAALWAAALGGAGWAFGAAVTGALARAAHFEELALGALLCGAMAAWWGRRWRARAESSPARTSG